METLQFDVKRIEQLINEATRAYTTAPERALEVSQEALQCVQGHEGEAVHTRALRARGLALHYNGRHKEGMACLHDALKQVRSEDVELKVRVFHALSSGHHLMGSLLEELYFAQMGLDAARKAGEPELIWYAQTAVALACAHCGDKAQALDHFRQIVKYQESLTNQRPRDLATALNNLAMALLQDAKPAEAVECFNHALECENLPETMRQTIMSGLAEVLHTLGRTEEAVDTLTCAVNLLKREGYSHHEVEARMKLGSLLSDSGKHERAIEEFKLVLEAASAVGTRNFVVEAHEHLARAYMARGQPKEAFEHLDQCLAATRELNTQESAKALAEIRVQLEVSDATHRAEVSHLRNVELVQAHEKLQAAHEALRRADAERAALLEKLEIQSRTDPLTGLANRRELDARLAAEIERSHRYGSPLTVSICDLDHFKQVNDRFGHSVGDDVLRALASILRTQCRELDIAARYGGEEFCMVFPQTSLEEAILVCERIRCAVESYNWASIDPKLSVTLSMGLSSAVGETNPERIVSAADVQLYRAKREGRNRVCGDQDFACTR